MELADNWTTQLRKGVLELCILNIIGHDRVYGYNIVRPDGAAIERAWLEEVARARPATLDVPRVIKEGC